MLSFFEIYNFVMVGCLFCHTGFSLPLEPRNLSPESEKIINEFASELSARNFPSKGSEVPETLDFPEEPSNYDYEFSDVGDLFENMADRDASHSPAKRYSDATATDMRSRLERLKLFRVQQKFLQTLMGKRNSRDPFSYLLDYFQQKMENGQSRYSSYDEILNEIQRELGAESESDRHITTKRFKRDAQMIFNNRLAVLNRIRTQRKLEEILKNIKGGYRRSARNSYAMPADLPDAIRALIRRNGN